MARSAGIGARVQGMKRYYGLVLVSDGTARLIKGEDVLSEKALPWQFGESCGLRLRVTGSRIQAWVDDRLLFDVQDTDDPYQSGGVALIIEEGHTAASAVRVKP